jgi:hypothetical protein
MRVLERETRLDLQVLCHEHHVRLELRAHSVNDYTAATVVYSCRQPDCLVHYNSSQGYFILSGNGHGLLTEPVPHVKCKADEMPMYLAEVLPGKLSYRLWKCPKCKSVSAVNP